MLLHLATVAQRVGPPAEVAHVVWSPTTLRMREVVEHLFQRRCYAKVVSYNLTWYWTLSAGPLTAGPEPLDPKLLDTKPLRSGC